MKTLPIGNRVILQMNKEYLFGKNEKGKKVPMLDEYGDHSFKAEDWGMVLSSNVPTIKKGARVYPIIRGGVPLRSLETKKYQVIVIDIEDLYAQEI